MCLVLVHFVVIRADSTVLLGRDTASDLQRWLFALVRCHHCEVGTLSYPVPCVSHTDLDSGLPVCPHPGVTPSIILEYFISDTVVRCMMLQILLLFCDA